MADSIKLSEVNPIKTLKPGDHYVAFNEKRCIRCLTCIGFCKHFNKDGINYIDGKLSANKSCHADGLCVRGCPVKAITRYQLADDGETLNKVEPMEVGF